MRNISFSLTTRQIRDRSKTVTRRLAWRWLVDAVARGEQPLLCAIEKGRGLKKGEHVNRLCLIRVVGARLEALQRLVTNEAYGMIEATLEGFPHLTGEGFAEMFIKHNGGSFDQPVTRIQFEYLEQLRALPGIDEEQN